ncbi:MAG: hypothetical protein ABFD98_13495 [Syntrophobacteraceae bacterium]
MKTRKKQLFWYAAIIASVLMVAPATLVHAAPASISSLSEKILIAKDGSARVQSRVDVADLKGAQALELPMNFKKPGDIAAYCMNSGQKRQVQCSLTEKGSASYLVLNTADLDKSAMPIFVEFNVPVFMKWSDAGPKQHDLYEGKHSFDNLSAHLIEKYNMELVLPEGWAFHKVLKSEPAVDKNSPKMPYRFFLNDKLSHLALDGKDMKFGRSANVKYSFKAVSKSPVTLVVVTIVGILYLIFFRDLLAKYRKLSGEERLARKAA